MIVKAIMAGATNAAALRKAGYSDVVARTRASDIMRLPEVRSALTEAMERAGLTPDTLAQSVADGLQATVVVATKDGAVDSGLPDHKTRLQAFDRGARAYGLLGDGDRQTDAPAPPPVSFTVNFVAPKPPAQEPDR